jgi:hypothetical protein
MVQFVFQFCKPRKSKCPDLTSVDLIVISHALSFFDGIPANKHTIRVNTIAGNRCFVVILILLGTAAAGYGEITNVAAVLVGVVTTLSMNSIVATKPV